jgi:hypothetical protein
MEFHNGTLLFIALILVLLLSYQRNVNASKIQDHRPICLLDVSFKIITKVLVIELVWLQTRLLTCHNCFYAWSQYY